ncbi:MAG: D-glycerate dehydrogenase [Gudongella sp.]|nr:D-glycerate dehydrogenase [Gudongella sp.]
MSKPKVIIGYPIADEIIDYVKEHCELIYFDLKNQNRYEELKSKIKDAEGVIALATPINEELLNYAPKLKVVSNITVGYNNCDIEAMKEKGVVATHSPGILDHTVADHILALMLAASRRIPEQNDFVKSGSWKTMENPSLFSKDINGATLGIIGMGRIGEEVVKRAKGFDMNIIYYNRNRKPDIEKSMKIKYMQMEDLLIASDFVVVSTPLTDETFHLMGEYEFGLMKSDAIFINTSRGPVVDEKALIKALQNKEIGGAGLDVFEQEPIAKENPLLSMDNVVLTPHLAGGTKKTMDALAWNAARCMVETLEGKTVKNIIPEMK